MKSFVFVLLLAFAALSLAEGMAAYVALVDDGGDVVKVKDPATDGIVREIMIPRTYGGAVRAWIDGDHVRVLCGDGEVRTYDIRTGDLVKEGDGGTDAGAAPEGIDFGGENEELEPSRE